MKFQAGIFIILRVFLADFTIGCCGENCIARRAQNQTPNNSAAPKPGAALFVYRPSIGLKTAVQECNGLIILVTIIPYAVGFIIDFSKRLIGMPYRSRAAVTSIFPFSQVRTFPTAAFPVYHEA
jgi:hypothetical protein